MTHDNVALLLQSALLGAIGPSLRAVGFTITQVDGIRIVFCYDGRISDEDREFASVVETEVMAGVDDPATVSAEIVQCHGQLPEVQRWVFCRR